MVEIIKDRLLKRKEQLLKQKAELAKEDPFANSDRLTDNAASDTEAAEQYGHDRVVAVKGEIDITLVRIRRALSRLKNGKWGRCETCGKPIEARRLAIDATVTECVACSKNKL